MDPVVYVGREGISTALLKSTQEALQAHELIKIKLGQNCPVGKKEASIQLAELTESSMIQLIGKTILLYRPNTDLPEGKRVSLTRS